ncbi:AraC family transcriptional regulator [Blastopirellula sp. J2-11]|uniref:AraC family transcriptional regulator n=1 Tax=Blastopirellula sp. J2-11 TaxID=2943192 RepID=UPI0021C66FDC|nr:AraC family transcriptional regulator [Blastopirellula sp. J2-11]UUO05654.1 AraC family transcriptional regulator [Blastopirellula sp. J2-11]
MWMTKGAISSQFWQWEVVRNLPGKMRDRIIAADRFHDPNHEWDLSETLITEAIGDPASRDESYYLSVLINSNSFDSITYDIGAGIYKRPNQPGNMLFGDSSRTRKCNGWGPFHSIKFLIRKSVANARISEMLGQETVMPEILHTHSFRDAGLETLLKQLRQHCRQPHNAEWRLIADQIFDAVLERLLRVAKIKQIELTTDDRLRPNAVNQVIDYIHAHLEEPIRLADLAQVAGVSRCHFSRLFHQTVGIRLNQFLTKTRVDKSLELLQVYSRQVPLREIAKCCGFYDRSHLIREFRREYGVTPDVYRQFSQ